MQGWLPVPRHDNYDLANSGGVSGGSGGKCRFCAPLSAKHGSFFFSRRYTYPNGYLGRSQNHAGIIILGVLWSFIVISTYGLWWRPSVLADDGAPLAWWRPLWHDGAPLARLTVSEISISRHCWLREGRRFSGAQGPQFIERGANSHAKKNTLNCLIWEGPRNGLISGYANLWNNRSLSPIVNIW